MRLLIRIRKMDKSDYEEQCAVLDLYMTAMNAPDDLRTAAHEALRDEQPAEQGPSH